MSLPKELLDLVKGLDLQDCKDLAKAVRTRAGLLAEAPPPAILKSCTLGATASVQLREWIVTGEIIEITGHCVLLRFTDGSTAAALMATLLPDGFGLKKTALPPLYVSFLGPDDDLVDSRDTATDLLPVLYGHSLYLPVNEGAGMMEARRLLPSAVKEPIPAALVTRLVHAGGHGLCL